MAAVPLAAASDTFFAILTVGVLVLGYVGLWAIWHFGFRGRGDEVRRRDDDL